MKLRSFLADKNSYVIMLRLHKHKTHYYNLSLHQKKIYENSHLPPKLY